MTDSGMTVKSEVEEKGDHIEESIRELCSLEDRSKEASEKLQHKVTDMKGISGMPGARSSTSITKTEQKKKVECRQRKTQNERMSVIL